jgi:membrane-bound metal-dependent hydrolase YbcI (DUF457 family)
MANWKGHIGGGVACAAVYAGAITLLPFEHLAEAAGFLHDWQMIVALFVISILFALFPDVDTNSKGQDVFFGIIFPLDILLIASGNVLAAAYLGLIAMLPILGHHRGWTHKKWAMAVVPLPILLVPYLYNDAIVLSSAVFYGAAVVGYFSHLLFDGLIWKAIHVKHRHR